MQDRYAFDVGDFGKLGLLRQLVARTRLRLGVLWYACAAPSLADDGKHVGYLRDGRFDGCDDALLALFRAALPKGRSIAALQQSGALPRGVACHARLLAAPVERPGWFAEALRRVERAELVFCDPDNGIAAPGSTNERRRSPKHVLLDELAELSRRGQSLVVYHHLDRSAPHREQIALWRARLSERLGLRVEAVRISAGSSRAYFIAAQKAHEAKLAAALDGFFSSGWAAHFERH